MQIYLSESELEIDRKAVASREGLGGPVSIHAEEQFLVEMRGSLMAFKPEMAQSFYCQSLRRLLDRKGEDPMWKFMKPR